MAKRSFRRIESADSSVFKRLRGLLTGRGVRKNEATLAAGSKIVSELLRSAPERCRAWINTAQQPEPPLELPVDADWYQLSATLFREIDVSGTGSPILLVDTPQIPEWDGDLGSGCTVFVPFQDPENVGTVIRSALAFGVTRVVLLEGCANPYHPKALRASAGAVFQTKLCAGPTVQELPGDLPIIPLSPEGKDLRDFEFPQTFGLLPGVEGPGLPGRFRGRALSIAVDSKVESLNAATAAAIALYAWRRSKA